MQLYARNMMAVSAASAVLAAGVLAAAPVEVSARPLALRTVSAPVELTTGVADCLAYGVCGIYDVAQVALAVPAYAVTQAALLGADVVEVVGAAVAYGATFTAAVASPALSGANLGLLLGNGYLQGQPAAVPECGGSFCGDVGSVPTVMMARQRLDDAVGKLKTDWANTFSPDHFNAYVAGLRLLPAEVLPSASLRSRPTASLASRARAASVTPRQAPSAKAAAATVEAAPTAEQSQRRAARGAAHRAERSGAGGIE